MAIPLVLVSKARGVDLRTVLKRVLTNLGDIQRDWLGAGEESVSTNEREISSLIQELNSARSADGAEVKVWVLITGDWGIRTSEPLMSGRELGETLWGRVKNVDLEKDPKATRWPGSGDALTVQEALDAFGGKVSADGVRIERDKTKANQCLSEQFIWALKESIMSLPVVRSTIESKEGAERKLAQMQSQLAMIEEVCSKSIDSSNEKDIQNTHQAQVARDRLKVKIKKQQKVLDDKTARVNKLKEAVDRLPVYVQDVDTFKRCIRQQEGSQAGFKQDVALKVPFFFQGKVSEKNMAYMNVDGDLFKTMSAAANQEDVSKVVSSWQMVISALRKALNLSSPSDCPRLLLSHSDVTDVFSDMGWVSREPDKVSALPWGGQTQEDKKYLLLARALEKDVLAVMARAKSQLSEARQDVVTSEAMGFVKTLCQGVVLKWQQWLGSEPLKTQLPGSQGVADYHAVEQDFSPRAFYRYTKDELSRLTDAFKQHNGLTGGWSWADRVKQVVKHNVEQMPIIMLVRMWLANLADEGKKEHIFYAHSVQAESDRDTNSSLAVTVALEFLFYEAKKALRRLPWKEGDVFLRPTVKAEGLDKDMSALLDALSFGSERCADSPIPSPVEVSSGGVAVDKVREAVTSSKLQDVLRNAGLSFTSEQLERVRLGLGLVESVSPRPTRSASFSSSPVSKPIPIHGGKLGGGADSVPTLDRAVSKSF